MYLVKFFHRPPGDNDRELLLIAGDDPRIIGIRMHANLEIPTEEFLREQFSDIDDAVAAYRRHAAELAAAGYVETTHTRFTRRDLPEPESKRDWQKALDELMLTALGAPLEAQDRQLGALEGTPALREPLYLWLAAHRGFAAGDDNERTLRLAREARDTLAWRRAGKTPHYAWTIAETDLEARIFEVLSWAHLRANEPAAALDAIEQALKIAPNRDRSSQRAAILRGHFPERSADALDVASPSADHGRCKEIGAPRCLCRSWDEAQAETGHGPVLDIDQARERRRASSQRC
jgi:tetratricopeptide (TPR) repeat protein